MTTLEQSKKWVAESAYIFCCEDLCSTAGGNYDTFMDFLMRETDQRWIIPHYLRCLFADDRKKGYEWLAFFLYSLMTDDAMEYLLGEQVISRILLLDNVEVTPIPELGAIFDAYDKIRKLIGDKEDMHSEDFRKQVSEITQNIENGDVQSWFQ